MSSNYNYESFSADDYNFDVSQGLNIGDKAFDVVLETTEGKCQNILDFDGDYLVLEMGSITCPLFQGRRDSMSRLERDYKNLSFAILYVREAHPGDKIKAHDDYICKKKCAAELRSVEKENRVVFIDDIDGHAHKNYGGMPNSIFIINKNKEIVFKLDWNNPVLVRKAIKALLNGKEVSSKDFFYPVSPVLAKRVLERAGKGSGKDFLSSLPKLIWKNLIKRNFRALFRGK